MGQFIQTSDAQRRRHIGLHQSGAAHHRATDGALGFHQFQMVIEWRCHHEDTRPGDVNRLLLKMAIVGWFIWFIQLENDDLPLLC
jgi:hypothetical protein